MKTIIQTLYPEPDIQLLDENYYSTLYPEPDIQLLDENYYQTLYPEPDIQIQTFPKLVL